MGVSNLWDAIRPASERKPLPPLAASYYCGARQRQLRIGVDASIWLKQCTVSVGSNPIYPHLPLQAFFYKLQALFNAGISVLLVFDGPERPKIKRGKFVQGRGMPNEKNVQLMADAFGFQWVRAPAEAEAELAVLQQKGVIDLILSDDADTFVFGATWVMRNHSKNLSGTAAQAKHDKANQVVDHEAFYTLFRAERIQQETRLTHGGMVLVALMSGGDYEPAGVENCGHVVSQALARCGFGDELLTVYDALRWAEPEAFQDFLADWRERLREELRTNSRKEMSRKAATLADKLPDTFPVLKTLDNYIQPITTVNRPTASKTFDWSQPVDLSALVEFITQKLIWDHQMFISRFRSERGLFAGLVLRDLLSKQCNLDIRIARSRTHPSTGNAHEYRIEYDGSAYASQLQACLVRPDPNEQRVQELREKARAAGKSASDSNSDDEAAPPSSQPRSPTKSKTAAAPKDLLWLLASTLRRTVPDAVEEFEQEKEAKEEKKRLAEERKAARARGEKPSPVKRRTTKKDSEQKSGISETASSARSSQRPPPDTAPQVSRRETPSLSPSPTINPRTSPTIDELFSSQPSQPSVAHKTKTAAFRAPSHETVVDLCSSPEKSPVKHRRSPGQATQAFYTDGMAERLNKSPKKGTKHTFPQQGRQKSKSTVAPVCLDLSSEEEFDEQLPSLPDPATIVVKAAPKAQTTSSTSKSLAVPGNGILGFRSTKASISSSRSKVLGRDTSTSARSKPRPRGKPVYIDIDSD